MADNEVSDIQEPSGPSQPHAQPHPGHIVADNEVSDTQEPSGSPQPHIQPNREGVDTKNKISSSSGLRVTNAISYQDIQEGGMIVNPDSTSRDDVGKKKGTTS